MKKIFSTLFIFAIVLSGCGSKIDYTDPQVYMDLITNKVNELDSTYLENMGELVSVTSATEQSKEFIDSYKGLIESVVNKIPKQAEAFYNGFSDRVNSFNKDISEQSQKIQDLVTQYNDAGASMQKLYDKSLSTALNISTKIIDKMSEVVNNATEEDIAALQSFGDLVAKYEEETGTSIKDEVQSQVEA